jgi:hypothetical protein
MQSVQEVFARIQENKKKQKDLRSAYKDALDTSLEYQEITEKLTSLREKKKQIEQTVKEQFAGELTKLDDLKIDLASDTEVLTDLAMTQLMKGETVEVKDEYDNAYSPSFKVNFKKIA